MSTDDGLRPPQRHGDASEHVGGYPWVGQAGAEPLRAEIPGMSAATEIGMRLARRALAWRNELFSALGHADDLSVTHHRWPPPGPDPLTASGWWHWRDLCDCPLERHHRWNCALTPIWAQTMRDLDVNPWTGIA